MGTDPFPSLKYTGVYFPEQLKKAPGCGRHSFITAFPIGHEVPKEIFVHGPWLPPTNLTDGIQPSHNYLVTHTRVDEFLSNLPDHRVECIRWCQLMNGLRERGQNGRNVELAVGDILDHVCVESEYAQSMRPHNSR